MTSWADQIQRHLDHATTAADTGDTAAAFNWLLAATQGLLNQAERHESEDRP